jgi:hypothetical protein
MDETGEILKQLRPTTKKAFERGFKPVELLYEARAEVARTDTKKSRDNLALIEAVFKPNAEEFDALKKTARGKGVKKEIRESFESMLETWPILNVLEQVQKEVLAAQRNRDQKALEAAQASQGQRMYELYKTGTKVKDPDFIHYVTFWMGVADGAVAEKDKKAGKAAIKILKKQFKGNKSALKYLDDLQKRLNE